MTTVYGTPFSDHIDVTWGLSKNGNIIFADGGNDWVSGWDGPDSIFGMEGNDILIGGASPDILDGGTGVDRAAYWDSPVGVSVSLVTGTGSFGTAAGDFLTNIENLGGSPYNDFLSGNDGSNWLDGSGGNDVLKGGGGADRLDGYLGDDTLLGGSGADDLNGGPGTDWAEYNDSGAAVIVDLATGQGFGGTAAGDTLVSIERVAGSAYDDLLIGSGEDETLFGGDGNDTLKGGGGADILNGGSGSDTASYDGSDVGVGVSLIDDDAYWGDAQGDELNNIENLTGSAHDDFLTGDNGANTLRGQGGSDWLVGGGGADTLQGGPGVDIALYFGSPAGVVVSLITGTGSGGEAQGDTLTGIEDLSGSNYDDQLWGNDADNYLAGLNGDDTLKGGGGADLLYGESVWGGGFGDDTLIGGAGADTMLGGLGSDTYYVDNPADVVTEYGGQGNDVVFTTVSYTLTAGADVETLRTTSDNGFAALNLTGNSSGNVVRGNNGHNVINGGDGNDELTGLGGSDSFLFDSALDAAINVDAITDFNVEGDTILLDQDIFSSSLGLGNISAGEFVIGTAAVDANDRIIYDSTTGALSYDSDGLGGTAAIQFALLGPGLALTHIDFVVV
jgi:Ca2+-binding RTX toxin-like protein